MDVQKSDKYARLQHLALSTNSLYVHFINPTVDSIDKST